jgi:toxin ParE1/3/4
MSDVITVRVDRKTRTGLEKLAGEMDRTRSRVVAEAIRAYLELNEWQIAEIKEALKEADAGDFAGEQEVQAANDGSALRVKWLRRALRNLDEEAAYIARDSPQAVARFVERIGSSVERLKSYPPSGHPGRVSGTRELVVTGTPYIAPYLVRGEAVEILRVFHGSRKWPAKF